MAGHGHSHEADHGHSHGGAPCSGHGAAKEHGANKGDLEAPLLGGCGHDHGSANGTDADQAKLKKAVYFALFMMFVEIFGGIYANSLAIITDAAHMLSDVGGFVVSLVALQLAAQGANKDYTYGFKQAEVLGALLSIALVWSLTAILLWEAGKRFMEPEEIDGKTMFIISVIGFLVNLVLMQVLGHGHSHGEGGHGHSHGTEEQRSIAVQAAVAHVIGDIVQSLGVCLASLCIWQRPFDIGMTENGVSKWNYADPCCTVLFGILVLFTTKSTLVFTIESLMVKAPKHIDQDKVVESLLRIPNVDDVHDFHIWSLGSSEILCTAHVMVKGREHCTSVLEAAIKVSQGLGIGHSTFQIEISGEFDPAQETFGGLCENPKTPKTPADHGDHGHSHGGEKKEGHGHAHGGDKGHGHAHGGDKKEGHGHAHGGDKKEGHGHAHGGDKGHGGHGGGHAHDDAHGGDCCSGHAH